jgi:aminoglycoside phosphotransferase
MSDLALAWSPSMTPPLVRHHLVIRHPSRAAILLVRSAAEAALPSITTAERHTAEVDHINAAVRETFGLTTIFLRSLFHDEPRHQRGARIVAVGNRRKIQRTREVPGQTPNVDPVERCHELAARGGAAVRRADAAWCDVDDLRARAPDVVGRLQAWRASVSTPHQPVDGREWERAGWWDEAIGWIREALRPHDGVIETVTQLRAWPSSSVLLVRTTRGDFYFKAVASSTRRECAVTAYLAEHLASCSPTVVAVDLQRAWLLMRASSGVNLEGVADVRQWERAAETYARLQFASRTHSHALRSLGCGERGVRQLATQLERCGEWAEQGDGRFSAEERRRIGATVPVMHARCAELETYDIPLMLEHGDLWPGNFLVDDTTCVVIDWEEAAIGHPFFSFAPFLVGLREYQPALATAETVERIFSAYLKPFAPLAAPVQLRTALDLAIPLAFCDMALRYDQQRPSMVRLHPWMRELVPRALRLAFVPPAQPS